MMKKFLNWLIVTRCGWYKLGRRKNGKILVKKTEMTSRKQSHPYWHFSRNCDAFDFNKPSIAGEVNFVKSTFSGEK